MNGKQTSFQVDNLGLVLCAVVLGILTGCVGQVNRGQPGAAYDGPPSVETTFAVQDDYVYYPNYECYYSVSRHQYAYREGNDWVARPAPPDVSSDVLRASPSVKMDFHDSPAQHHATVAQTYPKNWKPAAQKPAREENSKDEAQNQH